MKVCYPRPLSPGDRIGITAPSSGVPEALRPRLDFAVRTLRERGFEVELGTCLDGRGHVSAPAGERAGELMQMLCDPAIRAIVPPWGGETAIDLLPHLDFARVASAEPTWVVGYSDISTLIAPLTLLAGVATVHAPNLMDTPYGVPKPLLSWLEAAALPPGATFRQSCPGVHRSGRGDDWAADPGVTQHPWNGTGAWRRLDAGRAAVDVRGRLIGGCVETLSNLAGTRFLDTGPLRAGGDGLLVYVEAAEDGAYSICRQLHGMRLAGFFDGATAVLVGRTSAPDSPGLTQADAVVDALAPLGIPLVADFECGHVPPQMPLVNGALGRLVLDEAGGWLEQTLA